MWGSWGPWNGAIVLDYQVALSTSVLVRGRQRGTWLQTRRPCARAGGSGPREDATLLVFGVSWGRHEPGKKESSTRSWKRQYMAPLKPPGGCGSADTLTLAPLDSYFRLLASVYSVREYVSVVLSHKFVVIHYSNNGKLIQIVVPGSGVLQ